MFKRYIFFLYLLFLSSEIIAKPISFDGLKKLSDNDVQSITSINIYDDNLGLKEVNILIKELSLSDLVYEVNFNEYEDYFLIKIVESDLIENIFAAALGPVLAAVLAHLTLTIFRALSRRQGSSRTAFKT